MENRLGIIIPVYNEGENINFTLSGISRKVFIPHTIYMVYDFEEDNTLPAAREFAKKGHPVQLIRNKMPGVVGAIKTGLRAAKEPYLLVTMADLSDDYAVVDSMCQLMDQGYDLVCGSRHMKGGQQIGGPRLKKFLAQMASRSLRLLTGIPVHDVTNSFKLYRKSMVDSISLESTGGFEIGMEITVKAYCSGFRITEVPSVWTNRQHGQSRFKLMKWIPHYLKWYSYAVRHALYKALRPRKPSSTPW